MPTPNPNRPLRPGEKIRISANAWNRFLNAAKWVEAHREQIAAQPKRETPEGQIALVRNDSGTDKNRGDVLGIGDPVFDPGDSEPAFLRRIAVAGVVPSDHAARFLVLAEPIASGKVGRAWIAGACPALIEVDDESDDLADVVDGALKSGPKGSAKILWKEAGTGSNKWALLRLGTPLPRRHFAEITDPYLAQGGDAHADLLDELGEPIEEIVVNTVIDGGGGTTMSGVAFQGDQVEVERRDGDWYAVGVYRLYEQPEAASTGTEGGVSSATAEGVEGDFTIPVGLCLTDFEEGDELVCFWHETNCEWQCGKLSQGELGCGLFRDPDDENKLKVKVEELAGFGLTVNAAGECDVLDLNCGAVVSCVAEVIPEAGCGLTSAGTPPVFSVDAEALAGVYLVPSGSCGLAVDLPALITGLTNTIAAGNANGLVSAILDAILGNEALRKKFCKLACKCTSDPPASDPPECDGKPVYECDEGEWSLSEDCGCELPIPPDGECDECDDPIEGTCCTGNKSLWKWED